MCVGGRMLGVDNLRCVNDVVVGAAAPDVGVYWLRTLICSVSMLNGLA